MPQFRVIIAGGRNFYNYKLLKYKMQEILKNINNEIVIVSGHCDGADKLGEMFAKEKGYRCKIYEADWPNINVPGAVVKTRSDGSVYNAVAGHQRNQKMADNSDALVAFWDGKSPGTKDMIDRATKSGLKIRVIKY